MVPFERDYIKDKTIPIDKLADYTFTEENGAHTFIITQVTDAGEAVDFTGSATAYFMRADGGTHTVEAIVANGKIHATLNADCYHVPGRFIFSIYNVKESETICVYVGVGNVYRTRNEPVIDSGEVVPSLDEIEALFDDMEAARVACVGAAGAANGAAVGLGPYNAVDVVGLCPKTSTGSTPSAGITWNWTADGRCVVNGATSSAYSINKLWDNGNTFPPGMAPGKRYKPKYSASTTVLKMWWEIAWYIDGVLITSTASEYKPIYPSSLSYVDVPDNATGARMRLGVSPNSTISNDTITLMLIHGETNDSLSERVNVRSINTVINRVSSFDIMSMFDRPTLTSNGVTFTWNGSKCTFEGAVATGTGASYVMFDDKNHLVYPLLPGDTLVYGAGVEDAFNSSPVWGGLQFYNSSGDMILTFYPSTYGRSVQIPDDAVGMTVLVGVSAGFDSGIERTICYRTSLPSAYELEKFVSSGGNIISALRKLKSYVTNGVTFEWAGEKCTISGAYTSGTSATVTLFDSESRLPLGVYPGSVIYTKNTISPAYISYQVRDDAGNWTDLGGRGQETSPPVNVPNNAVGMRMILNVSGAFTSPLEIEPFSSSDRLIQTLTERSFLPRGVTVNTETERNLNNLTKPGVYILPSGRTYTNSPWSSAIAELATLEVGWGSVTGLTLYQRVWNAAGGEWVRYNTVDTGWTAWICTGLLKAPTAQGTYVLRCSVNSNGVPTYSWVSA